MEILALLPCLLALAPAVSVSAFPEHLRPTEGASVPFPSFTGTGLSFLPRPTERPNIGNDTGHPFNSPSSLHFQCRELDELLPPPPFGTPSFSDGPTPPVTPTRTAESGLPTALQSLTSNSTLVSLCSAAAAVEETCGPVWLPPISAGGGNHTGEDGKNFTRPWMGGPEDGDGKNLTRPWMGMNNGGRNSTESLNATMIKVCNKYVSLTANGNMSNTDAALEALNIAQADSSSGSGSASSTGTSSSSSNDAGMASISGLAVGILPLVVILLR